MHIAYNVFNINLYKMNSLTETCHFKFILFIFFLYGILYFQFLSVITRFASLEYLSNMICIFYRSTYFFFNETFDIRIVKKSM